MLTADTIPTDWRARLVADAQARLPSKEEAAIVARSLKRHSAIHDVLLFGSTARTGRGHDFDLILITSEEVYIHFLDKFQERLDSAQRDPHMGTRSRLDGDGTPDGYLSKGIRFHAVQEALDLHRDTSSDSYWELPRHERDPFEFAFEELKRSGRQTMGFEWMNSNLFDIFLFPANWRERLPEIQLALPNRDPKFMENLAREAIQLT